VMHDLELAGIIHALKMWRHYLLDRRFLLLSDHNGLRYLFDQPNLNVRQARWLATLNEFEFEVMYIKGKEKRVAYALSRRVQVNHITTMISYGTYVEPRTCTSLHTLSAFFSHSFPSFPTHFIYQVA